MSFFRNLKEEFWTLSIILDSFEIFIYCKNIYTQEFYSCVVSKKKCYVIHASGNIKHCDTTSNIYISNVFAFDISKNCIFLVNMLLSWTMRVWILIFRRLGIMTEMKVESNIRIELHFYLYDEQRFMPAYLFWWNIRREASQFISSRIFINLLSPSLTC